MDGLDQNVNHINYIALENSNNTVLHDGDILAERSLICLANHTRTSTSLFFDVVTNNIDIAEGTVLCTLKEKYRPQHTIHFIGYSYNPKEIIELSITTNGNITVFGNHSLKESKIYFSVSYLLK